MNRWIGEWCSYNCAAGSFHTKKHCSRLLSREVEFYWHKQRYHVFCHPLGDLGVTYYEHVTPMFQDFHWLHIDFKLAVLVYRCLHGLAPRYLSDHIQRVADSNHRSLRSSSSSRLTMRRTRLTTVGDCAFPVIGSRLWNSLPSDVNQ